MSVQSVLDFEAVTPGFRAFIIQFETVTVNIMERDVVPAVRLIVDIQAKRDRRFRVGICENNFKVKEFVLVDPEEVLGSIWE